MVRDVITKDRHNECQGDCRTDKLITPATKMSWSDFENWSSESERTSQTTGCCATITRQLTLRFQFKNFWRRKTFPYFPHPPNSPDLAPCDFYLFSKLKLKLKGHHFETMENITDELCKSQIKHHLDATLCRFYFCRVSLHVSGVKRPSSGVFKTSTAATGTCVIVAGKSSHLLIRTGGPNKEM